MTFRPANFDPSIDPTADQVRALRDAGPDGPVVMLNLLKFREQANYPAGSPHAPCSGTKAYRSRPALRRSESSAMGLRPESRHPS